MATPFRGTGMIPNDGMNKEKRYGKPQNVLDGQSLIHTADQDMSGWGNGNIVKRPYLETTSVQTGSRI